MACIYRVAAQMIADLSATTKELNTGYLPLVQLPKTLQNLEGPP